MRVIAARLRGVRTGSALGAPGQATAGLLAGDRAIVRSMALIKHDLPCRPARLPDSAGRRLCTAGPATATNDSLPASTPSSASSRRSGAAAVPRRRGAVRRVPLAISESGQLGARRYDPRTARTEIHDQGGVNLDADNPAEAVRIVGNLIPHGELLRRRSGGWGAEGTSGQEAPGRGAGWLHHYQDAPADSMRPPGRSPSSRTGESLTNSPQTSRHASRDQPQPAPERPVTRTYAAQCGVTQDRTSEDHEHTIS